MAWHVAVLTVASILSASPTAASQIASVSGTPAGPKLAPGKVVERVVSITDTAQRYAVYLPSSYRTDRRWPLLVLMDPRGRAMVPMNLIRDAAERLGYMVISSYNTMSDGPIDPNGAALTAILTDAQKMLALDPRRLYLVGFSGTARSSWLFGYAMRGYVAGIVGVGAGMPPAFTPPERVPGDGPPPVFFASVGTTDFNYDEVRRLEGALPGYGVTYRVKFHDGHHSWPPAGHLAAAVEWMELQAMIRGLKPVDSAWVAGNYTDRMARAEAELTAGSAYDAYLEFEAIARDFAPLYPVASAQARARQLRESPDVRTTFRQLDAVAPKQLAYTERLAKFLLDFRRASSPPPLDQMLDRLQIADLKRRAAQTSDTIDALAARRCLENVLVYTSFYEPREFLTQGEPARALALLDVAREIRAEEPSVCYRRAWALAGLGRPDDAVAALQCVVRGGRRTRDELAGDPNLAPLHGHAGFEALLAGLPDRSAP